MIDGAKPHLPERTFEFSEAAFIGRKRRIRFKPSPGTGSLRSLWTEKKKATARSGAQGDAELVAVGRWRVRYGDETNPVDDREAVETSCAT